VKSTEREFLGQTRARLRCCAKKVTSKWWRILFTNPVKTSQKRELRTDDRIIRIIHRGKTREKAKKSEARGVVYQTCPSNLFAMSKLQSTVRELCGYFVEIEDGKTGLEWS
jgi:hypothetical protein